MAISRRGFLDLCRKSAIGLTAAQLLDLEKALASPTAPTVLWLQGASCTGCSVSFLNRISDSAPQTAGDVLINTINLAYHPTLMAVAGQSAANIAEQYRTKGGYVLVVEGGVPTAFGGATCWAWSSNGADVTFLDAVNGLAANASKIICVGTCACYGGIPAAPPNPTAIKGVQAATGKATLNIPGCPTHPDWIVWAIANVITNSVGTLDSYGRPTALFDANATVHSRCPRRERGEASTWGQDGLCLEELGCRGPSTPANCPGIRWNGGQNWCVDANALCLGCTNPEFPYTSLRRSGSHD